MNILLKNLLLNLIYKVMIYNIDKNFIYYLKSRQVNAEVGI